jgi:hypothetical protein
MRPRKTNEAPVRIVGLEIGPEDNELAVTALKEAYGSAFDHKPQDSYEGMRAKNQFYFGKDAADEMYAAEKEAIVGYRNKMSVYSGVNMELLSQKDGRHTFYEYDSFPAEMVFSGIMFGISQLNQQRLANGQPLLEEPSVTYVEGVPTPGIR